MRTKIAIALLMLLTVLAEGVYAQDVPKWASDQLDSWYAAYNSQDAERIASIYAKDARITDAHGRDEILASFKKAFSEASASCPNNGFEGFRITGPIAAGWGTDTCEITPTIGDRSYTVTTRWLAIYERQDDGSWATIRDFFEVVE